MSDALQQKHVLILRFLNQESAIDFFQLFFTDDMLQEIYLHDNHYAWQMIVNKQYYADSEGAWKETTVYELKTLPVLIIYFGLVCQCLS